MLAPCRETPAFTSRRQRLRGEAKIEVQMPSCLAVESKKVKLHTVGVLYAIPRRCERSVGNPIQRQSVTCDNCSQCRWLCALGPGISAHQPAGSLTFGRPLVITHRAPTYDWFRCPAREKGSRTTLSRVPQFGGNFSDHVSHISNYLLDAVGCDFFLMKGFGRHVVSSNCTDCLASWHLGPVKPSRQASPIRQEFMGYSLEVDIVPMGKAMGSYWHEFSLASWNILLIGYFTTVLCLRGLGGATDFFLTVQANEPGSPHSSLPLNSSK